MAVSTWIADSLVENRIIKEEERDLYEYGIRQLCFASLNLFTEVCIGILSGMLMECMLFLLAYIPLRRFAGGFHAKSELRCYGISTLLFGIGLIFTRLVQNMRMEFVLPMLFIVACCIIFAKAPVESNAKPLDELEYKVFQKRARWILGVHIIIFVLAFSKFRDIPIILAVADTLLSVMLLMGIIKNKTFEQ